MLDHQPAGPSYIVRFPFEIHPQADLRGITEARGKDFTALSENLTERPLLRDFLHPLNREEPTLVTAIRLGRG